MSTEITHQILVKKSTKPVSFLTINILRQ